MTNRTNETNGTDDRDHGEMAEWTMARDSKSRILARVSGVQIPLSPYLEKLAVRSRSER